MHINNPEALKTWLTIVLEPLCDADPSALARYVLALLKKDKSIKDLQQCMNEQLAIFLGSETKPFVVQLFEVISSEEYLNSAINVNIVTGSDTTTNSAKLEPIASSQETQASTTANESDSTGTQLDSPLQQATKSNDVQQQQQQLRNRNLAISPRLGNEQSTTTTTTTTDNESDFVNSSPLGSSISKLRDVSPISPVKTGADSESHRKEQRRRSARSRSRSRSRTRRNLEREKYSRQHAYRNKSPPSGDADRRKSNPFRRNSGHESRSPKYYKRSHSPMDTIMGDDRKGTRSLSPTSKNDRCRDFDEKGYCMRGETCPWDHGVNPVVLEDINNPTMMTIQTAPHTRSGGEYNPDAPEIWSQGGASFGNGANRNASGNAHNNGPPNSYPRLQAGAAASGFRGGPPFPFPLNAGAGATTPLQRELISVPVVEANSGGDISASQKRRYEPEDTVAVAEGPTKRKLPINSRLGPPGRVSLQNNSSLELRKVPRGLNSIAHLNNHFCKFGKIVNIQVTYEGDPEAAIVTFSTHAEANVAYRSTEAVLNNRFIKVFWHTPGSGNSSGVDNNHNSASGPNLAAGGTKDDGSLGMNPRKNNQYSLNNTVPATPVPASTDIAKSFNNQTSGTITSGNSIFSKTTSSSGTVPPTSSLATNRVRNNRINRAAPEAIRKKKEDQVKAAVQLAHGLHKRKHELLQGYLKQMRSCVELVERLDNTDPQRTSLLTTIKTLQVNIDTLNKEIASDQAQITAQIQPVQAAPTQYPFRKSKELQKKELLDIELELIAQQQEGNDTTAIQKRIEELQKSLGTVTKPIFSGARPARVRPAPPGSTSVDRRPTTILIAGFVADECDAVLGHFKHYGEITKNEIDKTTTSLKISYATRLNAEQAMLRGRRFRDKQLQISWFVQNTEPPKTISEEELLDESVIDETLPTEIRLEDEEDDEETEDRSWRR